MYKTETYDHSAFLQDWTELEELAEAEVGRLGETWARFEFGQFISLDNVMYELVYYAYDSEDVSLMMELKRDAEKWIVIESSIESD